MFLPLLLALIRPLKTHHDEPLEAETNIIVKEETQKKKAANAAEEDAVELKS